jgi:transcriptional regulator with XRE-family HTH domain
VTALSDLIRSALDGQMSARELARIARSRGHSLNHDTVARYLRGDHGVPDEATLRAFSDVLPVTLAQLRAAADLPSEVTEPYQPPPEASRLSRRQRRAVDEIIRAMVEPTRASAPQLRRVARKGQAEPPA